ncbi:MAG TPA: TIGR03618 family F420-dependent PPOX class oxidoreductase [Trebonia sp.]
MQTSPRQLTSLAAEFLRERHLATLTTVRADGSAHVVPVGFTWDADTQVARVITSSGSVKVSLARRDGAQAVLCQVDGRRWLTLAGVPLVTDDPARVADAVARYAQRYRQPRVNPSRVAIEITVTGVTGSSGMTERDRSPG